MKAINIDWITSLEYDRLQITFKDGSKIVTDQVYFKEDGTLEFGFIYKS